MFKAWLVLLLSACVALPATAQNPTWRKDLAPIVAAKRGNCHGASAHAT